MTTDVVACPYCGFEVPASNAWAEIAHMNLQHPDIIEQRLEAPGGLLDASTRFDPTPHERETMDPTDGTLFPHHFSSNRKSGDMIDLEMWNEDGTHVGTINVTHAVAVELISTVAAELVKNPYAR